MGGWLAGNPDRNLPVILASCHPLTLLFPSPSPCGSSGPCDITSSIYLFHFYYYCLNSGPLTWIDTWAQKYSLCVSVLPQIPSLYFRQNLKYSNLIQTLSFKVFFGRKRRVKGLSEHIQKLTRADALLVTGNLLCHPSLICFPSKFLFPLTRDVEASPACEFCCYLAPLNAFPGR